MRNNCIEDMRAKRKKMQQQQQNQIKTHAESIVTIFIILNRI